MNSLRDIVDDDDDDLERVSWSGEPVGSKRRSAVGYPWGEGSLKLPLKSRCLVEVRSTTCHLILPNPVWSNSSLLRLRCEPLDLPVWIH